MRKVFGISVIVIALVVILGIIVYVGHPIVISLVSGTAKDLGKPISAVVYTNGHINNHILVYKNKNYGYVLSLTDVNDFNALRYIQVDPKANWVGRPSCISANCYDVLLGHLIQNQSGQKSVNFKDDVKGFDYDPGLKLRGRDITFSVPPGKLNYSIVRISIPGGNL